MTKRERAIEAIIQVANNEGKSDVLNLDDLYMIREVVERQIDQLSFYVAHPAK